LDGIVAREDEARERGQPAFRLIARDLEQQVIAGELPVGTALPSEQALATRFNVSRSTIRESIRLLEQLGLIRREEGRNKLRITTPRSQDISSRMKTAFYLQETTFEQLWQVLAALEPGCAQSAAIHASDEQLRRIADNLERTKAAQARARDLVELDIEFHALVAAATGNHALQLSRESVGELFYPAFIQVMTRLNAGQRLILAHQKIYDAIASRDGQEARNWMERHIGDFQRGCVLANLDLNAPISGMMTEIV